MLPADKVIVPGTSAIKREQAALDYCAEQGIGTLIRLPLAPWRRLRTLRHGKAS
jgi:hypothetical protein